MDNVSSNINKYSDAVLRSCYHYLEDMKEAETAYEEVFVKAFNIGLLNITGDYNLLPELIIITRKVCIADTIKDDNEEAFLTHYLGLSKMDAKYIMGKKGFSRASRKSDIKITDNMFVDFYI